MGRDNSTLRRLRDRIAGDGRGQSESLALVLLVAITILGVAAVLTYGQTALGDARQTSQVERTEHAMTVLDARGTMVAHGRSGGQVVGVGANAPGQYHVREDAGWMRVRHRNYSGTSDETIYNGTLGAVVYRNGGTEIAYQGGGVWRTDGAGSVMVSPPEFHYRDATLTLPLVGVRGNDSAAGETHARVESDGRAVQVFPNTTGGGTGAGAPYDDTGAPYLNTIEEGEVIVTVHSDYYRAWADYFRSRTEGVVTVDHDARTASVELVALGTIGYFDMPREGNSVEIRGLAPGHRISNFTIVLAPDDLDSARFNNLQWSFHAERASQEMEIHLRKSDEIPDPGVACDREWVAATVYYSDSNGNTYHGWHTDRAFPTECVDRDGDGVADETRLVANLTGDSELAMTDLSSSDLEHFNPSGATRETTVTFDEHSGTVDWESRTFSDGGDDDERVGALVNHYMAVMGPNVDLTVDDKESDTIHEEASYGWLEYDGEGTVVYLYISENRVRVSFD